MTKIEDKWYIGIDFGTSFNYVFGWKNKGKFKDFLKDKNGNPIEIVDPMKGGVKGFASKFDKKNIGRRAKGNIIAGENDIKTLIRCDLANEEDKANAQCFFELLFTALQKNNFPDIRDIENIVVGVPCVTAGELKQGESNMQTTNLDYKINLTEIMAVSLKSLNDKKNNAITTEEIKTKIKCIDEPILAGYAYFAANREVEDQQIIVIDGGGGTLDFAHIVKEFDRLYCDKSCGGIGPTGTAVNEQLEEFLGTITDGLLNLTANNIETYKMDLFTNKDSLELPEIDNIPDDSSVKRYNLLILNRNKNDTIEKKNSFMNYHTEEGKVFYLATDGEEYENQDDEESDIISAPVEEAKKIINTMFPKTMNPDEKKKCHPDKILFIGGMSHIADFRDRVIKHLKENGILDDEDCKNSDLVIFPEEDSNGEHIKGTHTIGGITLTSSNIVALGACIAASNKYFAIESENDIYVGTYDVDEENYNVHMLGDVYIRFENGEQKVEFPLFDSDKTPIDRETAVFIQNIAKYKTDGRSKDVIWEKIGTQKILKFKIIVKSKGADGTSKELCSFPVDKGMLVVSNGKKDDISIDSDGKTHNEKYFMIKLNKDDDCSLLISLNNFIVNIYALPVEDIMAFSSEKSKDTEKLSNASCCII